jgi:hypothetical protein
MMHMDDYESYDGDARQIVRDVEDQMMRFSVDRQPDGTDRVPDRGGDKNPIQYEIYDPTKKYRKNPVINALYGYLLELYHKDILNHAKRVDEYQASDFLWQRTTWEDSGPTPYVRQDSGLAYLLPYYIGRHLEVFEEA